MTEPVTDREFILDQDRWPIWPFLPLKVPGRNRSAFLYGPKFNPDRSPLELMVGNIFEPQKAEVREYLDVDALLADGWVVD